MATRKLKNFEFAGLHNTDAETYPVLHCFQDFETANGFAFVVSGSEKVLEGDQQLCEVINERVRYYLDNEVLDDPREAVRNALVYANGFVYEMTRKKEGVEAEKASVLCVLVQDGKAYYAWMGEVSLFLYTGKRRYPLTWPLKEEGADSGEPLSKTSSILYLGVKQLAEPALCEQALVPVDGDQLFLGTGTTWALMRDKAFCTVMADSMPTHTKLQRLIKLAGEIKTEQPAAAQLIAFYNLDQTERSFAAGKTTAGPSVKERIQAKIEDRPKNKVLSNVLIGLGILILAYMFYDLFLVNPNKPVNVRVSQETAAENDTLSVTSDEQAGDEAADRTLPADVEYVVRSGDTWGSIYRQYEVCSWFIRNHPANEGKFDPEDNPVYNTRLVIPIKYSGSRSLNPAYYQEFTLEKVGNSCQNVNEAFKRRFDRKVASVN
ncbi:MAG: hypothetical protein V2I46_04660 [Bacteroides sp.]|jgi:hypothetical protein|nr:hypothetical protein [Bacteroides sp.]